MPGGTLPASESERRGGALAPPGGACALRMAVDRLVAVVKGLGHDRRWAVEDELAQRSGPRARDVDAHVDGGGPQRSRGAGACRRSCGGTGRGSSAYWRY